MSSIGPTVGAGGGDRPLDPAHRQETVEGDGAVVGELEASRLERDLGVVAGVEEVGALDDVGAELRRAPDGDRVDACAAGQAWSLGAGLEACLDIVEAGAERSHAHVTQLRLEGRVVGIGGEGPGEGVDGGGGHRLASFGRGGLAVRSWSVPSVRAA